MDFYKPFLSYIDLLTIKDIFEKEIIPYDPKSKTKNSKANRVKFVAVLVDIFFKQTKGTNQKFAVCTFEDDTERIKGYIWNIVLEDIDEESLIEGEIFLIEGDLKQHKDYGNEKNISVWSIQSIDQLIKKSYKGIIFSMPEKYIKEEDISNFYALLSDNPGECFIELEIIKEDESKERIKIGEQYKITPNAKFINTVVNLFKFCNVYPIENF